MTTICFECNRDVDTLENPKAGHTSSCKYNNDNVRARITKKLKRILDRHEIREHHVKYPDHASSDLYTFTLSYLAGKYHNMSYILFENPLREIEEDFQIVGIMASRTNGLQISIREKRK